MWFLSLLTQDMVAGIIRAGLASAGGAVVANGWASNADWQTISGALLTAGVTAWSVWAKRKK